MKRWGILSLAVAALLLSGCDQKSEQHTQQAKQAQQSAPAVSEQLAQKKATVEQAAQTQAPKAQEQAPVKEEPKAEAPAQVAEKPIKVEQEAKSAVEAKAQEAKAAIDGAKLYSKCAACHGPKGERKALGKSAVIAGMAKDEVLQKLKKYQAGALDQYGMGAMMKSQVAGMSEADLEALAEYISKLK